jgi:hypothetical protein
LIAALAASPLGAQNAAAPDHVMFDDAARDVRIRYDFTPAGVEFSAHLPAGWSFGVAVDGDQDGRWGDGPENDRVRTHRTADRNFGQDSRNGIFCSQYILTFMQQDPSQISSSSECGGYPSHGSVGISGFDSQMRATITLRIPAQEIFGERADAHLQICLWDTHQLTCRYTPAAPFVLRRPAPSRLG